MFEESHGPRGQAPQEPGLQDPKGECTPVPEGAGSAPPGGIGGGRPRPAIQLLSIHCRMSPLLLRSGCRKACQASLQVDVHVAGGW